MVLIIVSTIIFTVLLQLTTGKSVPKQYSSYRESPYCNPSEYFTYPEKEAQVVDIVKYAISKNLTVKAFGTRHSQTDIICTEGIPVENLGLKFYQINDDDTATFGAGVTLYECTAFLKANKRALRTTPAYGNITLAGAIGTGAHGSTIKYTASISEQLVGALIVDGLGNVQNITTEEDLRAFRVHLGLLGILVQVTLRTQPLYKTLAHNYVIGDEVLTNGVAQEWAKNCDQMTLYWFPTYKQVVVANWTFVPVSTKGRAKTNDHVPSTYPSFNILASKAGEQLSALSQNTCPAVAERGYNLLNVLQKYLQLALYLPVAAFVPIYETDGVFENPAVGYYDDMFAPTCIEDAGYDLQCFWAHGDIKANASILDNELALDLSDMPSFINEVKNITRTAPAVFPLQGILIRFTANSTAYMSNSYGRDSVAFEFYLTHRANYYKDATASLAAFQTIMQTLTKKYGGRSHWAKSGAVYHSSPLLDLKLDPIARSKFVAAMNKFDPNEVFINNFGRRIKGTSTAQDISPDAAVHCALLDNCFCSRKTDCASYQTCTTLKGYSYPVCQTIGEKPVNFLPLSDKQSTLSFLDNEIENLPSTVNSLLGSPECLVRTVNTLELPNLL